MTSQLRCLTCPNQPIISNIDPTGQTVILIHIAGGHIVQEEVLVKDVIDTDRQRKDYGDVADLARSIKQFGIIQPMVIAQRPNGIELVAGGRRLAACRSLGIVNLVHARDFVWRDELSDDSGNLQLQTVELEENLRRKDLAWHETVLAKNRLFELMKSIHGEGKGFGGGRSGVNSGFSLRKLSEMLGENSSVTSRDLQLAGFLAKHPMLAKLPTKADAMRKLGVAITTAAMQNLAKTSQINPSRPASAAGNFKGSGLAASSVAAESIGSIQDDAAPVTPQDKRWTLYDGRFEDNIQQVSDTSVDLICTDLPYNIGLGTSSASHSAGLGTFTDDSLDIVQLCADVAVESYRVMRNDRFAVFFYGMNYHQVLYDSLVTAGFTVDVYPFIWLRDRSAPPDGFARYSKTYDPAFVVSKGTPRFIRPNLPNSLAVPSVRGPERLHAAQKPVAIMQKFIEDMTTPNCVVLDMFAGAGTTGVAALRCKRKAILFELEPANCVLIRAQLGSIK
jgi:adenine-specific DNA-methyltransferase